MSRTLLLVICDFLLLSLLALARFDTPEPDAGQALADDVRLDERIDQDLFDLLALSLEAERDERSGLAEELDLTREELENRARQLAEREQELAERTQAAETISREADALRRERERLAAEKARAEEERREFLDRFEATRKRLEQTEEDRLAVTRELAGLRESSAEERERARQLQEALRRQQEELARLAEERERLESERRTADMERMALRSQLEVAEAERRLVAENLETARQEIVLSREERRAIQRTTEQLAEGVGALADSTAGIRQAVKQLQPVSMNALFEAFRQNRVGLVFDYEERGLLGSSRRSIELNTILATDGSRNLALAHIDDTPFGRTGLENVEARLTIDGRQFRVPRVGFLAADPRIVAVAVPSNLIEEAGVQAFPLAAEPLRFPDAVLIDNRENYYGESPIRLDPDTERYMRMRSTLVNRLFGEFSPGRGDLVFAKTGEFIGIMVNNSYAAILPGLSLTAVLNLNDAFERTEAESVRVNITDSVRNLPREIR